MTSLGKLDNRSERVLHSDAPLSDVVLSEALTEWVKKVVIKVTETRETDNWHIEAKDFLSVIDDERDIVVGECGKPISDFIRPKKSAPTIRELMEAKFTNFQDELRSHERRSAGRSDQIKHHLDGVRIKDLNQALLQIPIIRNMQDEHISKTNSLKQHVDILSEQQKSIQLNLDNNIADLKREFDERLNSQLNDLNQILVQIPIIRNMQNEHISKTNSLKKHVDALSEQQKSIQLNLNNNIADLKREFDERSKKNLGFFTLGLLISILAVVGIVVALTID